MSVPTEINKITNQALGIPERKEPVKVEFFDIVEIHYSDEWILTDVGAKLLRPLEGKKVRVTVTEIQE